MASEALAVFEERHYKANSNQKRFISEHSKDKDSLQHYLNEIAQTQQQSITYLRKQRFRERRRLTWTCVAAIAAACTVLVPILAVLVGLFVLLGSEALAVFEERHSKANVDREGSAPPQCDRCHCNSEKDQGNGR